MRQAVAADVGNDEPVVESEASVRTGAASRPGANRRRLGAVGDHGQLAARDAASLEILRKRLGNHDHARRLGVQKVGQCAPGLAPLELPCRISPSSTMASGQQAADLEHEGHALGAAPAARPRRREQRRRGGDHHVGRSQAGQAEQHGREHQPQVIEFASARSLLFGTAYSQQRRMRMRSRCSVAHSRPRAPRVMRPTGWFGNAVTTLTWCPARTQARANSCTRAAGAAGSGTK